MIFGRALKIISSLGVRSLWAKAYNIMSIDLTPNRVTEETFCYCMPVELAQGVSINNVIINM